VVSVLAHRLLYILATENNQTGGKIMKTYTIPRKMSNSGSIHDIASDYFDRDIKFPEGTKYAVVLSSYYSGKGYTTHKTEAAVCRQTRKLKDFSFKIIDSEGFEYFEEHGRLGVYISDIINNLPCF
jgi:hypothetical protein